jgi:hypothetical protein
MSRLIRACAAVAVLIAPAWDVVAYAADTEYIYAPPGVYGEARRLRAHLGSANYTITLEPLGNVPTEVIGKVQYIGLDGQLVTREFTHSINFRTGNVVAAPVLQVKAIPTGVQVKATVY